MITSSLLPVPHGFSTRQGGVSTGPYASLNVGFSVGDDPKNVAENLGRLARELGVSPYQLYTSAQVHGDGVLRVSAASQVSSVGMPIGEGDALITDRSETAVGVKVADCVPILLVDPKGRKAAAVHSGWKGSLIGITARAVEALVKQGTRPESLLAAIGPCIRRCCYVVSPDLAKKFAASFGTEVVADGDQTRLDLPLVVKLALLRAGIAENNIDVLPQCTACDERTFFSHRRDRGVTGRHLAFAVCRF